jgi:hypothetical protein
LEANVREGAEADVKSAGGENLLRLVAIAPSLEDLVGLVVAIDS